MEWLFGVPLFCSPNFGSGGQPALSGLRTRVRNMASVLVLPFLTLPGGIGIAGVVVISYLYLASAPVGPGSGPFPAYAVKLANAFNFNSLAINAIATTLIGYKLWWGNTFL
jgi:hypothetical protein